MNVRKILVRSPNHLGDCVMSLPMINEVREAYPGSNVTVITPEPFAPLFENNLSVDFVLKIPVQYVHGLIGIFKTKEIIHDYEFDLGFVLPISFGAAAALKLGSVKERAGYITDGRRLLLTMPFVLPEPQNSEHRTALYMNLLRRASGSNLIIAPPSIHPSEKDVEKGLSLLSSFGLKRDKEYVVIAFRAVAESRRWGWENYAEVIRHILTSSELTVALIGSQDDSSDGRKIEESLKSNRLINLAGKTSLNELIAIISRARMFIGNDSGPAHVAAAVETPLIVLSGADDPKETSPISDHKTMLYASHLDCISCVKNNCPLTGGDNMRCMKEISQERVKSAVAEIIKNTI